MALTDKISVFSGKIFDLIEANKITLGFQDVFYGDQERIPRHPAVCVESGDKAQELNGAPRRTAVTLECILLVYHSKVQQTQTSRRELELLNEAVELLIHQNRTMDDTVIHCMVTQIEPGYMSKNGTMMRASRITIVGNSQVMLPYP